jgi:hypothetical protein
MAAMETEMNSLAENETWDLEKLPSDRKAIKNKWVYKEKLNSEGARKTKSQACRMRVYTEKGH